MPFGYRMRRKTHEFFRRLLRRPRSVSEGPNLLPLLIRVLACFSKLNGKILEEEIDSSLGFLRHDYPEAVYSALRKEFRQALQEQPDLDSMAAKLNSQLSADRKILLGIQLWDLICRAGQQGDQVVAFYKFMAGLGMTAQAIDIVYQLNASDSTDPGVFQKGASPLESLTFGSDKNADVFFKDLPANDRLFVYRYHDLILIKNVCTGQVVVNGRPLLRGALGRLYEGQRVVIGERVLAYQELVAYFNAKKNVAIPQVYLAINKDDEVSFERSRTRESVLEVRFGLKVQVTALRRVAARLNGVELKSGTRVEATLDDKIVFANDSELPLIDLRRRARALGGRFQLIASKSEYLVSNNPSLLDADDILLSPGTGGDVLLKISCDYEQKIGQLEVLQASRTILVGDIPVRNTARLTDGDLIRIDVGQVLRCNFSERLIEEERNVIRVLEARDLRHAFRAGEPTLDNINFTVTRGEMVCVMGASGCGKSTLLRTLAGQNWPEAGGVVLNGRSLYDELDALRGYIAYIPQDDAFDEQLTIEENLTLAAALRSPHLSPRERARRIDGKLIELGLNERRNSIVGSAVKKALSGGERKRLNIGLDMIGLADIYLFDEPTSGLSSKDSEHVIEIIKSMSHNKIVLVTIHQPSSKIFQMFNKVILLDKGGRLVFFGTPTDALQYFAEAENVQGHGVNVESCVNCGSTRPEFIFDVLETPLRDMSGDIIYEENSRGPTRARAPVFARVLARQIRELSPVAGREGRAAQARNRRAQHRADGTAAAPEVVQDDPLARRVDATAHAAAARVLEQAAQSRQRGHDPGRGAAAFRAHRGRAALQRERHVQLRRFVPHPDLPLPGGDGGDVPRVDQQRRRHHPRPRRAPARAQPAHPAAVLHLRQNVDAVPVRAGAVHVVPVDRRVRPGSARDVLDRPVVHRADGVLRRGDGPAHLVAGGRRQDRREHRPADPHPADHHGWRAHQVRGHEPQPRLHLRHQAVADGAPRLGRQGTRKPQQIAGARHLPAHADALELRGIGRRAGEDEPADGSAGTHPGTNPGVGRPRRRIARPGQGTQSRAARPSRWPEGNPRHALRPGGGHAAGRGPRLCSRSTRCRRGCRWIISTLPDRGKGVPAEQLYVNQKITDLVSKAEMEQSDYRNEERKQRELNVFFGTYKYLFHQKFSVHLVNSGVLIAFSLIVLGLLHASLRKELER